MTDPTAGDDRLLVLLPEDFRAANMSNATITERVRTGVALERIAGVLDPQASAPLIFELLRQAIRDGVGG